MTANGVKSLKKGLDLERVRDPGLTEISRNDWAPVNRSQDTVLLNYVTFLSTLRKRSGLKLQRC